MNHVIMCSKVNHGAVPHQWASVSDNNSDCVPISSRDGASKRDQHDPNDRETHVNSLLKNFTHFSAVNGQQSYLKHTISCASKVTAWQSIS